MYHGLAQHNLQSIMQVADMVSSHALVSHFPGGAVILHNPGSEML
jgi:hypothetical protein